MIKGALPEIPPTGNNELGNELPGVFALTLRAFAHVRVFFRGNRLKPALTGFAVELVEGHTPRIAQLDF
jgi:hypothetical protein